MGWFFPCGKSRAQLIEQLTRNRNCTRDDGATSSDTCLAQCYRGSAWKGTLWIVWERSVTHTDGRVETERWIECDLLQCIGGDWGHKPMEESSGPNVANCPLKYLGMVPPIEGDITRDGPAKWSRDWRERVRAHHQRRRTKLAERRRAPAGPNPFVRIRLDG